MDHLRHIRDTAKTRDTAIEAVYDAIADALRAGIHVQDVADASGYHRNHIRRIARTRGLPDLRHRPRRQAGDDGRQAHQDSRA